MVQQPVVLEESGTNPRSERQISNEVQRGETAHIECVPRNANRSDALFAQTSSLEDAARRPPCIPWQSAVALREVSIALYNESCFSRMGVFTMVNQEHLHLLLRRDITR